MDDTLRLQIASYNCRGFNQTKTAYITSLLASSAVLFLQEHWLSNDQLRLLGDIDDNFIYAGYQVSITSTSYPAGHTVAAQFCGSPILTRVLISCKLTVNDYAQYE